jgi:protein-tyrosine phosphatase
MAAPATNFEVFGIDEDGMAAKLKMVRRLVAQPVPSDDPEPGVVGDSILVGNKYHVAQPELLSRLGVTAVLNCASSGVRNLPLDEYEERGISYNFTNCARDDEIYPILHNREGVMSSHLEKAREVYANARASGGKVLFNCAAGQNRSATLAIAVQVLNGVSLESAFEVCAKTRPFVVENCGFQRQLVELEAMHSQRRPRRASHDEATVGADADAEPTVTSELQVPGLGTFNVRVPAVCTVPVLKQHLVAHLNGLHATAWRGTVGSSWLVFSMFGGPDLSMILEETAVERSVQLARLVSTCGLDVVGDKLSEENAVCWSGSCRFELILFSIEESADAGSGSGGGRHRPFTFRHIERENAPGTLLSEATETHLRAWDFGTGEAYLSAQPIVFSFSNDARQKREFTEISTSSGRERQTFDDPAKGSEGAILGMGANAVVHRVRLEKVRRVISEGQQGTR